MPKNNSTARERGQSPNARPSPIHVQHIADTAAQRALDAFADSPQRQEALKKIMQAAIAGTLEKFGLDPDDKASIEKFRANMVHLNTWREFMELIKRDGVGAATSWLVKGFMIVVSLGIVTLFGKHLSGN